MLAVRSESACWKALAKPSHASASIASGRAWRTAQAVNDVLGRPVGDPSIAHAGCAKPDHRISVSPRSMEGQASAMTVEPRISVCSPDHRCRTWWSNSPGRPCPKERSGTNLLVLQMPLILKNSGEDCEKPAFGAVLMPLLGNSHKVERKSVLDLDSRNPSFRIRRLRAAHEREQFVGGGLNVTLDINSMVHRNVSAAA